MVVNRVSSDVPEFKVIDQFYTSVLINPAAVTEGFHEVYRYTAEGLTKNDLMAKFYSRTNWSGLTDAELMREAPWQFYYSALGSPTSAIPRVYVEDGFVVFGYDSIIDDAPDTPYSTVFFQGFVMTV